MYFIGVFEQNCVSFNRQYCEVVLPGSLHVVLGIYTLWSQISLFVATETCFSSNSTKESKLQKAEF